MVPRFPDPATERPDLSLYALAQARASEVEAACGRPCKGCPGPEAEGGCLTRQRPTVVLDRRDWPMCPRGMLQVGAWRELVALYLAAQVSPLEGWPGTYPAWVVEGMSALWSAIESEKGRQLKLASAPKPGGAPRSSGRRVARKV